MLKVIGVDAITGGRRSLVVKTTNEQRAWRRAEAKGILPREVILVEGLPKTSRRGVVYLLRCGFHYKIGKSITPDARYGQLKIQLPQKPELVHEIRTNDVDFVEKHWHQRFSLQRENGEWFSLTNQDVAEFTACKRMVIKSLVDKEP